MDGVFLRLAGLLLGICPSFALGKSLGAALPALGKPRPSPPCQTSTSNFNFNRRFEEGNRRRLFLAYITQSIAEQSIAEV